MQRAVPVRQALVFALTGCIVAAACSSSSTAASHRTVPHTTARSSTTTAAKTTTTTAVVTTTSTTAPATTTTTTAPAPPSLHLGSSGPAVLALQQRLVALGYWIDNVNGTFGDATQQAVYAYQKVAGISRDGAVGPATAAALARGARPTPRSHAGHVIEIDLERDLLMVVDNGNPTWVLNTSTGGGYRYSSGGSSALAITPRGNFHVYRQIDGMRINSLGELWRPKYFSGGIAVHGDSYVPAYPVSHGCARVSNEAINWIWASNLMPIGTAVWVY